ncbi:MAG: DUF2752 domain-containing protein [Verrucomicrobia bacterium]|nr:DUF2752 domain-containing protein [Verrucomicrobiota bacterium]
MRFVATETTQRRSYAPLIAIGSLVVVLVALRLAVAWRLPLPFCGFKKLTGLPCPFCGSLRSLLAWSHLDLAAAFTWNPLAFLVCLGGAVWFAAWLGAVWFQKSWAAALEGLLARKSSKLILAALVVLNWVYLLACLPR